MLSDDDQKKWDDYPPHTKAKHDILIRYMGAWLTILGSGARARGYAADLVIVDAFAGRGRYSTDDLGSPLLLRAIAGDVVAARRADDVELFYIESNPANCAALVRELSTVGRPSGVRETPPIQDTFENVAPRIIEAVRGSNRSSFWFIDPFGYAGLPLALIQKILDLQRGEVLVTLMVKDMSRFLDDQSHLRAVARVLDLYDDDLETAIGQIKRSPNRMRALLECFVSRLESGGRRRRRYVTTARIAKSGATDTIYYLVHATCSAVGKREMKEAMRVALRGLNAFLGANHPTSNVNQLGMFGVDEPLVDYPRLRLMLLSRFAEQRIEFIKLLDTTAERHEFDEYLDSDIKKVLDEMAKRGEVKCFRSGVPSIRALAKGDEVEFPPA